MNIEMWKNKHLICDMKQQQESTPTLSQNTLWKSYLFSFYIFVPPPVIAAVENWKINLDKLAEISKERRQKKKMLKQQTSCFIRAYGNVMTEECCKLEFDAITTGKFPSYGGTAAL